MKKAFICIIAVLAFFNVEASAQKKHDKVQNDKIMFFSMRLDLTPEEAQVFWPLYNQYSKESWETHGKAMKALQTLRKKGDSLSDSDKDKLVSDYIEALNKESDLLEKYYKKFKKVLPVSKAAKVFVVEDEFRIKLLRQFSEERKKPEGTKDQKKKREHVNPEVECK